MALGGWHLVFVVPSAAAAIAALATLGLPSLRGTELSEGFDLLGAVLVFLFSLVGATIWGWAAYGDPRTFWALWGFDLFG